MRAARALPIILAVFVAASALAHPGHDAPPVHAHDPAEAVFLAVLILGIAVAGIAIYAVRRKRNKDR